MWKKIFTYILISYGISWLIWLPNVLSHNFNIGHNSNWLHIMGGLGPLFGAIITTLIYEKWSGLKLFFYEKYRFPNMKWLLVGLFMPIIFFLIAYLWLGIFGGNWIQLSDIGLNAKLATSNGLIVWFIWFLFFGIGEESGWRGFLLPELTKKYNALPATILLSVFWMLWHLPIYFYDKDFIAFSFGAIAGWCLGLIAGSILLGWLVKQSNWNLWPVILWHSTFNLFTAGDRLIWALPAIISMLVMIAVIWIIFKFGKTLY